MDLNDRMDKFDRRLDATLKIVQTGMKMLVKMQKETREMKQETHFAFNALIAAQVRTETKLEHLEIKIDRFIDSMGPGRRNGHSQ